MSSDKLNKYCILYEGNDITEAVESISLEDSLDETAYRASLRLVKTDKLPQITNGKSIEIFSITDNGTVALLSPGVVWENEWEERNITRINVMIYDKTIYLAKSEDEYLFDGQTASQRLKKYAADWQIKVNSISDTKVTLSRSVYRAQPIYSMILSDLRETVAKGGEMYRPRMTQNGLDLIKLGSNSQVWLLESAINLEGIVTKNTLEGAVTQVKVVGLAKNDNLPTVFGVIKGETHKYGTIQKIYNDSKARSLKEAEEGGLKLLAPEITTITTSCIDINQLRAGDKINLNNIELFVVRVQHDLGNPGKMNLTLAPESIVRRNYYHERSL